MNELYQSALAELQEKLVILPDKPEETPENTLKALWRLAQGASCSVETATATPMTPLIGDQEQVFSAFVGKRLKGTPLAYLTGRQVFMGIEMLVSPGALIPRKETQILANAITEIVSSNSSPSVIIDLCTGVGNLAIYCAKTFPGASVFASDLSVDAIESAKVNAGFCGVERIDFRDGNMFACFESEEFYHKVDLISCNPPYISQGRLKTMPDEIVGHEPTAAFDGGPLGISIISKLTSDAHRFLKPGGWVAFEIGLGQGRGLLRRIGSMPEYCNVRSFCDHAGEVRAVAMQKN